VCMCVCMYVRACVCNWVAFLVSAVKHKALVQLLTEVTVKI
jgi:hypothetical protein